MFPRCEAKEDLLERSFEGFTSQSYIWHRIDVKCASFIRTSIRLLGDRVVLVGDRWNLNAHALYVDAKIQTDLSLQI